MATIPTTAPDVPQAESAYAVIVPTLQHVAWVFDVKLETVKKWRQKGMPGKQGCWNLQEIYQWLQTRGTSGRPDDDDDDEFSRREADRRKAWADAKTAELKHRELEGELISLEDVTRDTAHFFTHARAQLNDVPHRLLGLLPADATGEDKRRFRAAAVKAIDVAVQVLHDWWGQWENDGSDSATDVATT